MKKENGILTEVADEDLKLLETNPEEFWKGVTEIGHYAFTDCSSLTSITIPDSVTEICNSAFTGCSSLTSITIPDNVTEIGDGAFDGCSSLTSIIIPESVTVIGNTAFSGCSSLTSITIPDSVTEIAFLAFFRCTSLKNITIPEGVTKIGHYAFTDCSSLTSITIPDSVTEICNSAFTGCSSLTSITIPDNVTEIGDGAFARCSSLTSITIPESVTEIGDSAFKGCNCLINITVNGKRFSVNSNIFNLLKFEELKTMLSQGKDFSAFNTLAKKLGGYKNLGENAVELFKLGKVLGLFEPESVTTKINGKQVPVQDVAYTLLQNILITNNAIDVNYLHAELSGLEYGNYCEAFLKFMSNKTNCNDMISNVQSLPQIVSWFRARQVLPPLNGEVQEAGDDPTIEENRYKVYRYSLGENGVYKDRWNAPTVQFIKDELAEKKYTGVTSDKKHIATALSAISAYKEQKFYDKASEIEDERRNLVEEGKLSNHILQKPLKQDIIEALDKYRERTKNLANQIVENCAEACETNVETANKLFTYEMLPKDSEEIYVMGFNTSCCARLFGAGGGAQRASILHPDVQPLVIRDSRGEIIAMSLIYVNREKGYAVANDVEVNNKYSGQDLIRREIYNKFVEGVDSFVNAYNREDPTRKPITKVHCGVSPNWTAINDFIMENPEGKILEAVDFSKYQYNGQGTYSGDWQNRQYVIWTKEDQGCEQ